MKVCGIVAEYNPFHNGHLYHLKESKLRTKSDFVICVMSGNFTQRGEAAIVDKWARTRMALAAGIDLVIELPVLSVLQPAEWFAFGAVKILHSLGVTTHICFGSEVDSAGTLEYLANFFLNEPFEYKDILKEKLREGYSYPRAQSEALFEHFSQKHIISDTEKNSFIKSISSPNSILAVEYIKALHKLKSTIVPVPIKRIKSSYHDTMLKNGISSATAVRKEIMQNGLGNQVENDIPSFVFDILSEEFRLGKGPVTNSSFENMIFYILRRLTKEEIEMLPDVTEGLENRIKRLASYTSTLNDLLMSIKSKRYVFTRLQRICLCALLGIDNQLLHQFNTAGGPSYARILGFSRRSAPLLSKIKREASIPLISKAADICYREESIRKPFHYDCLATDIYSLALGHPTARLGGRDYTEKIIVM